MRATQGRSDAGVDHARLLTDPSYMGNSGHSMRDNRVARVQLLPDYLMG